MSRSLLVRCACCAFLVLDVPFLQHFSGMSRLNHDGVHRDIGMIFGLHPTDGCDDSWFHAVVRLEVIAVPSVGGPWLR